MAGLLRGSGVRASDPQSVGDEMRASSTVLPVAALIVTLGVSGSSAASAAERDRHGRDRNGQASQGRARERRSDATRPSEQGRDAAGVENRAARPQVQANRSAQVDVPAPRGNVARPSDRRDGARVEAYRSQDPRGYNNAWRGDFRYDKSRDKHYRPYVVPRVVPVRPVPRHYYGPGGNFSIYFGWGSGYLFGAPYYGRVYGYVAPPVYGARVFYGDVRLQVRPRDAAVYVDGYYAGIVDDFDGVFQRLTLTVGPHRIELAAPGLEPRVLDVYVDAARTVDVRMDLLRY